MRNQNADYWINKLNLVPHPEGGFFKEIYRSDLKLNSNCLHFTHEGERNISTAIYYLLESGDYSSFHRIKSDEVWHFYEGSPLLIYIIDSEGELTKKFLGKGFSKNEKPMQVVPKNNWFAAEVLNKNSFSLVGCTVAPGFDFADFEMGHREVLKKTYPKHADLIEALTR